ncbi:TIR domain-containing protein [Dictyobacter halimunensis]|uniref:TIR domain-containing protein n=1 Tax=Dictyobacter halimunensis TaxID=3026934 RepID=UPI003B981166
MEIDEATRDEAGSPNILQTILKKITKADIFICDVSIINATSKHGRKVPNPNVVFELGYAVSELGRERIILLFNTAYGTHQDLPFDFKPHRATSYHLDEGKLNEGEQENLQPLIKQLKIVVPETLLLRRKWKRLSSPQYLVATETKETREHQGKGIKDEQHAYCSHTALSAQRGRSDTRNR